MVRVASAPGKLMLAGEYAVLHGAPAIVVAVDRRVRVTTGVSRTGALPAEVGATCARLAAELGIDVPELALDVGALHDGERKFGLGSSAAASVAAAALLLAGTSEEGPLPRARIRRSAEAGHAAVAPHGSGVDVACSTYGGFLRFRRAPTPEVHPLPAVPGLFLSVVFTGTSARTSELLQAVGAFAAHAPRAHREVLDALGRSADRCATQFADGAVIGCIEAVDEFGRRMAELGQRASAPIVEARLARIAVLAREARGAAKPSGAGGGDVAVGFFSSQDDRAWFERRCEAEGFRVLALGLGAEGVRIEHGPRMGASDA